MKEFNILVFLVVITMVSPRVVSAGSPICRTTVLGHEYAGTEDRTKDGIPCQRWDSQSPHGHSVDAAYFPEATLSEAHNYCRNPGSTPGGPWCYTTIPETRWQSCITPSCEGSPICRTTVLGHEYAGTVDRTKDGIPCQRWDIQSPHGHSVDAAYFPGANLSEAHNYCRNPGSTPGGPWCYTTNPDTRWQSCITPSCGECRSTLYVGKVDETKDGIPCQNWDSESPHRPSINVNAATFPEATVSDAHNYCRNPDGEPDGPWCYTTDPDTRWQYCNTPSCGGPWFWIQHVETGLCLKYQGNEKVRMWECVTGATEEHWRWIGKHLVSSWGNGQYGMYFDVFDYNKDYNLMGEIRLGRSNSDEDHSWSFQNGYLQNGCTEAKCGVVVRLTPMEEGGYRYGPLFYPNFPGDGYHGGRVGGMTYFNDQSQKWRLVPI